MWDLQKWIILCKRTIVDPCRPCHAMPIPCQYHANTKIYRNAGEIQFHTFSQTAILYLATDLPNPKTQQQRWRLAPTIAIITVTIITITITIITITMIATEMAPGGVLVLSFPCLNFEEAPDQLRSFFLKKYGSFKLFFPFPALTLDQLRCEDTKSVIFEFAVREWFIYTHQVIKTIWMLQNMDCLV